jgi:hypothetical protein
VSNASYLIFILGAIFEAALIWRLLAGGIWRRYPYFSVFVVFAVAQTAAMYAVYALAPTHYAPAYFYWGMGNLWARFLVVWEVFRQTFPSGSSLRRMVSGSFLAAALLAGTVLAAMSWGILSYGQAHSMYRALDRGFGFAQAVLILIIFVVARYYHVQLSRNIWGIAVAFGMYSSLSTVNNAFRDLRNAYFPYYQLLSPLSLVVMMGMWTWSVWRLSPAPLLETELAPQAADLDRWSEDWGRTVSTVRKAMLP